MYKNGLHDGFNLIIKKMKKNNIKKVKGNLMVIIKS